MIEHEQSLPLGKKSTYINHYDASLLFAIPRISKRQEIGVDDNNLPFFGFDIWNHYEVSWLNLNGKPMIAIAEIIYPCTSKNIIESKSMKLYFNSFNNTKFDNITELENIIKTDISNKILANVECSLIPINCHNTFSYIKSSNYNPSVIYDPSHNYQCLDELDIVCTSYLPKPEYLHLDQNNNNITEYLYSNLLKSNCLVTNQPDWGSIYIIYSGNKINHPSLLKYIVSLRDHNEFHEQCVERVFMDIMQYCQPKELTVYARYTRRGGLDINPYRSNNNNTNLLQNIKQISKLNLRLIRQ